MRGSSPGTPSFISTASTFPASSRNRRVAVASGLTLLVLLIVLVARWSAGPSTTAPAAASSSIAQVAPPPAPPERKTITLTIQVTPVKATVLLDGALLTTNPFRSSVFKDGQLHKLVASAPGYMSEERTLQYEQDEILELVLKRAVTRGGPPAPAANAQPAPGSDLKKAARPKASIDEEDPY